MDRFSKAMELFFKTGNKEGFIIFCQSCDEPIILKNKNELSELKKKLNGFIQCNNCIEQKRGIPLKVKEVPFTEKQLKEFKEKGIKTFGLKDVKATIKRKDNV